MNFESNTRDNPELFPNSIKITHTKMLSKLILTLSSLTFLSAQISTTCEWYGASYGQDVKCLPGWVVTGVCGSGRRADCKDSRGRGTKYWYMINCCQTKYQNHGQENCIDIGNKAGNQYQCYHIGDDGVYNQAIYGGCGSGMNNDCLVSGDSTKYNFSTKCCDNGDITVGPDNLCDWIYGNYGDLLSCPSGYVAGGYCGSGRNPACSSGATNVYSGVYCCPFSDNKN